MRLFILVLICSFLCACSTRPRENPYLNNGDTAQVQGGELALGADNGTGATNGQMESFEGGETGDVETKQGDESVLLKTGKAVLGALLIVVLVGVSILAKVPTGAP